MQILDCNSTCLYRIQGDGPSVSKRRIYVDKDSKKVIIPDSKVYNYLSITKLHHLYFIIKKVIRIINLEARKIGLSNPSFEEAINVLGYDFVYQLIIKSDLESIYLVIPDFAMKFITKHAVLNREYKNNSCRKPEIVDINKFGGGIAPVNEWNKLLKLMTFKAGICKFNDDYIPELIKFVVERRNYLTGTSSPLFLNYDSFIIDSFFQEQSVDMISEILISIYNSYEMNSFENSSSGDIRRFVKAYKNFQSRFN